MSCLCQTVVHRLILVVYDYDSGLKNLDLFDMLYMRIDLFDLYTGMVFSYFFFVVINFISVVCVFFFSISYFYDMITLPLSIFIANVFTWPVPSLYERGRLF